MANRNKLEGNASLLTHRRHWLQLDDETDREKQVLEHPTQPRNRYHSSNRGLKALAHVVALVAFLSAELLTPSFLKSKCDSSPGSLSEEEAEGMWGTAPALTSTEQFCPLLTTEMYLLINLGFWTQPAIVFWPDRPTVTPPLSYLEKNSNQGHPDIPKGWKRRTDGCLLLSLLLPQVIRLHGSPQAENTS